MSIGTRIYELRKKNSISQGQLAAMMDVSRQAVSKWENDTSTPDALKLINLADIFNVDIEYLATGSNRTSPRVDTAPAQPSNESVQDNPSHPSPLPLILFCLFFFFFGLIFALLFISKDD